ncbi:hypothetical protein HMPREF0044_1395 [Gleimia coleocanis DSM 15436]|uniref:DUF3043 domain-containing protein n=1 Tax=Gleimia coleocanis DSM 15436 TaxID=525245 RepID=C0W1V5_9ACTO|nr:DUF3043 domain-containing protein [Gleimia coleocanis]EEH63471.1 hypothetical protein HMPREF0044_1395 [Gleimia coleocanis DSM 15436]
MSDSTTGKGRPTPKRKDAEAKRRRDMIPADRKLAKKQARARQEEQWRKQQEGMDAGIEHYMPARDRGKSSRFIRDYVDARRFSISEAVMPAMFVMIITMMVMAALVTTVAPQTAATIVNSITWVTYGLLFASIVEATIVFYRAKARFKTNHPREEWIPRRWFYVFARLIMPRRFRQPKPQVNRGEYPE